MIEVSSASYRAMPLSLKGRLKRIRLIDCRSDHSCYSASALFSPFMPMHPLQVGHLMLNSVVYVLLGSGEKWSQRLFMDLNLI